MFFYSHLFSLGVFQVFSDLFVVYFVVYLSYLFRCLFLFVIFMLCPISVCSILCLPGAASFSPFSYLRLRTFQTRVWTNLELAGGP